MTQAIRQVDRGGQRPTSRQREVDFQRIDADGLGLHLRRASSFWGDASDPESRHYFYGHLGTLIAYVFLVLIPVLASALMTVSWSLRYQQVSSQLC